MAEKTAEPPAQDAQADTDAGPAAEKQKPKYPKVVFFIMANEFCERFSFYGMRAILIFYLTTGLGYSETDGSVIFHSFVMICYFTPLLGGLISDVYLGKFKTIFYISLIYILGNLLLSISSAPPSHLPRTLFALISLLLIGIGTGGIKPCVSAFGGDQFAENQEKERMQFFSIFYFCINAGALLSILFTPILREDVHCFNEFSCFPLAFGVPAALMIVALVVFLLGKSMYIIKPPEGNILIDFTKCISYAVYRRFKRGRGERRAHWLDYADDKYDKKLIDDVRITLKVLIMFLPLPVFWALFDQQGSRWTLQANKMDGSTGLPLWTRIKPDQMQVINPLLILIFIPVCELIIYPAFAKINFLKRALQRMVTGGMLAAVSFVVAAIVQLVLEGQLPQPLPSGKADLTIINALPCKLAMEVGGTDPQTIEVKIHSANTISGLSAPGSHKINVVFPDSSCSVSFVEAPNIDIKSGEASTFVFYQNKYHIAEAHKLGKDIRVKPTGGENVIRFVYLYSDPAFDNKTQAKITVKSKGKDAQTYEVQMNIFNRIGSTDYQHFEFDNNFDVFLPNPQNETQLSDKPAFSFVSAHGRVETYLIIEEKNGEVKYYTFVTVPENKMSMFWQTPQYIIITLGEVAFSITGLEFSYSQAPERMKSLLQAVWLLTVATGNLLVLVIAKLELFERQSYEFFLFAFLMFLDMLIFMLMAINYKYVKPPEGPETRGAGTILEEDTATLLGSVI